MLFNPLHEEEAETNMSRGTGMVSFSVPAMVHSVVTIVQLIYRIVGLAECWCQVAGAQSKALHWHPNGTSGTDTGPEGSGVGLVR